MPPSRNRHILLTTACLLALTPLAAHENLDEAIATATEQIAAAPDDARLRLQRGELHRLHGDWAAAAGDYDRAERLDPTLSMVAVARGRMLLESGHPTDALGVVEKMIDRQPVAARQLRGEVFLDLGRPADAAADFERAIRHSRQPQPDLYAACSRAFSAAGDDESALRILGDACPGSLEPLALELEVRLRKFDNALKRLDRLTAAAARKESWLAKRGEILEHMQRPGAAHAAFTQAWSALEAVPPARRHTAAAVELESRIKTALARLSPPHSQP